DLTQAILSLGTQQLRLDAYQLAANAVVLAGLLFEPVSQHEQRRLILILLLGGGEQRGQLGTRWEKLRLLGAWHGESPSAAARRFRPSRVRGSACECPAWPIRRTGCPSR